jgi:hypothetical protein
VPKFVRAISANESSAKPWLQQSSEHSTTVVIAGLDPAIHPLREDVLRRRWTTRNRVYPISGTLNAQVG